MILRQKISNRIYGKIWTFFADRFILKLTLQKGAQGKMESFLVHNKRLDTEGLELSYYRLEQKDKPGYTAYGVRIDMHQKKETGEETFKTKSIFNVFYVRKLIDDFIEKLVRNTVTPTTLEEITTEYIQDMLYVE